MAGQLHHLGPLVLALVLSSVVGLERELRHKVAGLRTHTLVGLGAAMFTMVGKYGFDDVLQPGRVVLNPVGTVASLLTTLCFTPLANRIHRSAASSARLCLIYRQGVGTLHEALVETTRRGFAVAEFSVAAVSDEGRVACVNVQVRGTGSPADLVAALTELNGMLTVESGPVDSQADDRAEPRSYA